MEKYSSSTKIAPTKPAPAEVHVDVNSEESETDTVVDTAAAPTMTTASGSSPLIVSSAVLTATDHQVTHLRVEVHRDGQVWRQVRDGSGVTGWIIRPAGRWTTRHALRSPGPAR